MPQPRQPAQPAPTGELKLAEAVREGSRWIHGRPKGTEFADWFTNNVKLHDDLDPERYVSGVVLITGEEKYKETRVAENGAQVIVEERRLVHTPYAKVETRVAYFWDYMALHPDWVGVIEPAPILGGGVEGLPPGFFTMRTTRGDGKLVNFACSAMRVRILKADSVEVREERIGGKRMAGSKLADTIEVTTGVPIAVFAPAVKMIPTTNKFGDEDPFALMKAETGAVGRALGMAGMLVIPGSGVATAEDMLEAQAHEPSLGITPEAEAAAHAQVAAEASQAPQEVAADPREEIVAMIERLESEAPEKLEEVRAWATERKLNLSELTDTQLRGVHKKLKTALGE